MLSFVHKIQTKKCNMVDTADYADNKRYKLGKRHFIHAYPIKGALNKDGELRSLRHRRISKAHDIEHWQNSVFYWWFACLKRNTDFKRCCKLGGTAKLADLYRDFGNIYESDDFWKWWTHKVNSEETRGAFLFAEAQAAQLEVLGDGAIKEDEDYLIVKVPLSVRNQHLVRNFRKLLSEHEAQVQKVRRKSTARYKVVSSIPSTTFKKSLKVYDYIQANKDAGKVEIAEACNLIVETNYEFQNTDDARTTTSVNLLKHHYKDDKYIKRFKKVYQQRCAKQVAQLLKQAEDYIKSSATNNFPQRYK